MRDGGDRQWVGRGYRLPAASAPTASAPAAGLPLVPALPLVDPHSCSEPCRGWPPGAPEGRALEAVEKVVTGRNEHEAV
jgi:hypothetical protein